MSNLVTDILANIGQDNLNKIFTKYNVSDDKKDKVAQDITSLFVGGLAKNAQQGGAEKIVKVLTQDHKDTLNKASDVISGKVDLGGDKILKHIFGHNEKNVVKNISKESSQDNSTALNMLKDFAPIILGGLSQSNQKAGNQSGEVLTDLLKMAMSSDKSNNTSLFKGIFDLDKDGNIVDDLPKLYGIFKKIISFLNK